MGLVIVTVIICLKLLDLLTIASSVCRDVNNFNHDDHTRKAWCMQNELCPSTIKCLHQLTLNGYAGDFWDLCLDDLYDSFDSFDNEDRTSCLVYSIGISNDYAFDLNMGRLGCEVHMFDPTVRYDYNFSKNVYFHQLGLYGGPKNESSSIKFQSKWYGKIQDENAMFRLDEIIEMLGHQNRTISVFKIDCEGCEVELFGHRHTKNIISQIKQILVEFHYSKALGVDSPHRIPLIANSYDTIINNDHKNKFTKFYQNDRVGNPGDEDILDELVELGFPQNLCCREVGFIRKCNDVNNSSNVNVMEYALAKYRKSLEGSIFGVHRYTTVTTINHYNNINVYLVQELIKEYT